MEEISDIRREHECKEGTIGPEGGRFITNHCEVEIPENAVDKNINFAIEADSKMIHLPEQNVQISPTLTCTPKIRLNKEATIKLPPYCTTEDEDVHVNVFAVEEDDGEFKKVYSQPLKYAKKDFSFVTKILNKIVIAIQKKFFSKTYFRLNTEVWYSLQGNFIGVIYINDKTIKKYWQRDLETRGYFPSQAVSNPISVKGTDQLEFKISCQSSKVIIFDKFKSSSFTTETHLADNEHKHYANFRLFVLPVGDEQLLFSCSLSCNGVELEQVNWNEIWVSQAGPRLEDLFKIEIIPTFNKLSLNAWRTFATSTSGLGLTDREISQQIDLENTPTKTSRLKTLMLWKDKESGMGKFNGEETESTLKDIIRAKTITCRETC